MHNLWNSFVVGDRVNSCGTRDIDCQADDGSNYRGEVSKTISGYACVFWDKQTHSADHARKLGHINKCRNPVKKTDKLKGEKVEGVWCYITEENIPNKQRWEYCDVRKCGPCDKGK